MADETLQIVIPSALVTRVQDAFCTNFGYRDQIETLEWIYDDEEPEVKTAPMIANPEKKIDFICRIIKENFIRATVYKYETDKAKRDQAVLTKQELKELGL